MKLTPMRFDLRVHPTTIAKALRFAIDTYRPSWLESVSHSSLAVACVSAGDLWDWLQPCIGGYIICTVGGREHRIDADALQRAVQLMADQRPVELGALLCFAEVSAAELFLQFALFGELRR